MGKTQDTTLTASNTSRPARVGSISTTARVHRRAGYVGSETMTAVWAYVARMVTDRHSFTVIEIDDGDPLTLAQVDEAGQEIDRLTITKAPRPATE